MISDRYGAHQTRALAKIDDGAIFSADFGQPIHFRIDPHHLGKTGISGPERRLPLPADNAFGRQGSDVGHLLDRQPAPLCLAPDGGGDRVFGLRLKPGQKLHERVFGQIWRDDSRHFGAARTGSVFAFAPFVGALGAFALGERSGSVLMLLGGLLMAVGIVLHLAENHAHEHRHEVLDHEHAHTHDDGHHLHTHDVMPQGAHSHPHHHSPLRHSHPHVPDAHHTHRH